MKARIKLIMVLFVIVALAAILVARKKLSSPGTALKDDVNWEQLKKIDGSINLYGGKMIIAVRQDRSPKDVISKRHHRLIIPPQDKVLYNGKDTAFSGAFDITDIGSTDMESMFFSDLYSLDLAIRDLENPGIVYKAKLFFEGRKARRDRLVKLLRDSQHPVTVDISRFFNADNKCFLYTGQRYYMSDNSLVHCTFHEE